MRETYEKLGAFYLGRRYDPERASVTEELTLYDSADLVTHGICVGMTGSGKTGLSVCLIEEALIDGVPVIAIDPKGDLGNLLLAFPNLAAADFEPWVSPEAARREGQTVPEYAAGQARLWRDGLAKWGQDPERIRRYLDAADRVIYTPGSHAGVPVSMLRSFEIPSEGVLRDEELFREQIQATIAGLLGLLGVAADPVHSREHLLLSLILNDAWTQNHSLTLAELIPEIQNPPFDRIGMFDLESFYPQADRTKLAMSLNGILASPGFSGWMDGDTLDIDSLLHTTDGRPRLSIFSIAHLRDEERMFFVSTLLNRIVSWMRQQPGSASLRTILYMDEIYGYLPPVANPPSKIPLLTMLKQARAYGLGVLMATQNPKDLDYKALSNAGTWFVGRLQTDLDQERVLDGLEGTAAGNGRSFDRKAAQARLASLDKRVFVLHNVHEDAAVDFHSRWALSYLGGPLTRAQIKTLMAPYKATAATNALAPAGVSTGTTTTIPTGRPVVPQGITEHFFPVRAVPPAGAVLTYAPGLMGTTRTHYEDARRKVDLIREESTVASFGNRTESTRWSAGTSVRLGPDDLEREPASENVGFGDLPSPALREPNYTQWKKRLAQWVYSERPLELLRSRKLKLTSEPGESERDFRVRLEHTAREERDLALGRLRLKYGPKIARLAERIRRAEGAIDREQEQASQQRMQSTISIGATVLGALFGRKLASATSVRGAGAAARSMSRARKEAGDVRRAQENLEALRTQLAELEAAFDTDCAALDEAWRPGSIELDTLPVRAKKTNIDIRFCGLVWLPYWNTPDGRRQPAWE